MWNVKLDEKIEDVENMAVLIETLWNVKKYERLGKDLEEYSINRNIVECKDIIWKLTAEAFAVLIETLWNVKGNIYLQD